MKFKIKETGEIKELNIYDGNDINWINDLIGNSGFWLDHNEGDNEEGNHIIKEKDFDWWEEYIDNYISDKQEAEDLAEELGIDISEVNDHINEALAGINDYDMEHDAKRQAFDEIREERKAIKLAASVMGRKGGSKTSEAKAKASAENGKKGGRPRMKTIRINEHAELTTNHPSSHYGIPVLVTDDGRGYGPSQTTYPEKFKGVFGDMRAAHTVYLWAINQKNLDEDTIKFIKSYLGQWPEGPQLDD